MYAISHRVGVQVVGLIPTQSKEIKYLKCSFPFIRFFVNESDATQRLQNSAEIED